MAGNRRAFDKAMKKAASHAWNKAWPKAIKEYEQAVKEFPDDPTALLGLAIAHFEAGHLEAARKIFQQLYEAEPQDAVVLSHLADIEERMNNRDKARALYISLGKLAEKQGDLQRAAEAWSKVADLDPSSVEAYRQLVQLYTDLGQTGKAVMSCVLWARELQNRGQTREMGRVLRTALRLEPGNPEVLRLLQAANVALDDGQVLAGEGAGPVETARREAWAELAQILFEDLSLEMMSDTQVVPADQRMVVQSVSDSPEARTRAIALIGRAVDLDSKGRAEGAIEAYQQAIRHGVDRVAAHFNLGFLYKTRHQIEEACRHLSMTRFHPKYALASFLLLGECYQSHGRLDLATQNYVQALKVADLQVVNETRAPEVAAMYDSITAVYAREAREGDEQVALDFLDSVRAFFRAENWLEKTVHLRTHLDELTTVSVVMNLADALRVREFSKVFLVLGHIRDLVNQGALLTAREQCYWAIEKWPTYLPLHFRLADISVRQGMIEDAVAKYVTIAEFYEANDNLIQASNVYRAILTLTPLDVKIRAKLIEMLINRSEIEQALEQYLALADAYYQLARVDRALEAFNEALRLTERSSTAAAWRLKILHFMADLYTQRVEWGKAVEIYEQIRRLAPDDERAGLHLMDLYFKQGKTEQGLRELQSLLQPYEQQNDIAGVIRVLREAVRLCPKELPVRARLSRAYIESGMREEAIAELDAIGEMQLEAGMRDEAIQTIRLIISLKPANERAYKQLLYHLLS